MIREGPIRLTFEYAAGDVASRFLTALRDDARILASRCSACSLAIGPARSLCPRCGRRVEAELFEVGPAGVVQAWAPDGDRVWGLVRLDGADTAMIHRLRGGSDWTVGQRVRACFEEQRTGSVLDLAGFEPEVDP